jgi:hypothetical protein
MLKNIIKDVNMRVEVCPYVMKDGIDVWVWIVVHSMENANHPGLKHISYWFDSYWKYATFK